MTKTARVYGGSLYDLAAEEKLDGQIMEQMIAVRQTVSYTHLDVYKRQGLYGWLYRTEIFL